MPINAQLIIPAPPYTYVNVPAPFTIEIINGEADPVTITGIQVIDTKGVFTVSDLAPCLPAKYQIVSGGTPVTSSIPAWGTATQANTSYYIGNVSGSSLVTVSTSGSYGGKNVNFTPISSSFIIPAGGTGSYQGLVVSSIVADLSMADGSDTLQGRLQARISVSGSNQTINADANSDYFLLASNVIGAQLQLVGSPLVAAQPWSRPIAFSNFDAYVQTVLLLDNGQTFTLPAGYPAFINYTSSDPSVISVVNSGPFGAATGSLGNPQITAGAGALTFNFPNTGNPQPTFTTISNEMAPNFTASINIGLVDVIVTGLQISPSILSITSGTMLDLQAYYITSDGQLLESSQVGAEPTWASSNATLVPVSVSGSITGSVNTQGNVLITATNSGLGITGTSQITLNLK